MSGAAQREENERPTWPAPADDETASRRHHRSSTLPDDPDDLRERFQETRPSGIIRMWTGGSIPTLTGVLPEGLGVRAAFLMMHIDGYLSVAEIAGCMQLQVDAILPHFIGLAMLGAIEMARPPSSTGADTERSPGTLRQEDAKLVQLVSEADEPLPTLPGVAPTPWAQHTAVVLRNGNVLDPRHNTLHASIEEWRESIVGDAVGVQTLINGQIVR